MTSVQTPGPRRWWALGALTLAVLAVGLDGTVLSLALPTLATALRASESDLQWFVSGYFLVLAAAMLPAGLLGDRFGRKKVLLLSVALFGAGSAACAFAPTAGAFIWARAVLGLAGAGIVVMALSALTVLFTEAERPRAVGIWAAANFLALPVGPILGGWLLTHFWWGWVFLMNLPVALVGLLAAFALLPESRAAQRSGLDPLGIAASSAGLVVLTYGLIKAGQDGWGDAVALGAMLAGLAILVGFFRWEGRLGQRPGGQPLIDLALLRSASFAWGVILAAVGGLGMIGLLFTMPQYFQGVEGTDVMGAGVRLLPVIAGLVLGAVPADRLALRIGAKLTVALGFLLMGGGAAIGASTGITSGDGFVAAWMAVFGVGLGLTMATAASAALREVPKEKSGVASALLQAIQKVGGPFGSAVLGSVLNSAYQSSLPLQGLPPATAALVKGSVFAAVGVARQLHSPTLLDGVRGSFVRGMDVTLLVSAGIAMVGLVLTLLFLPRRATPATAARQPGMASPPELERV